MHLEAPLPIVRDISREGEHDHCQAAHGRGAGEQQQGPQLVGSEVSHMLQDLVIVQTATCITGYTHTILPYTVDTAVARLIMTP